MFAALLILYLCFWGLHFCMQFACDPTITQPIPLHSFVFVVEHPDHVLLLEAPSQNNHTALSWVHTRAKSKLVCLILDIKYGT